MTDLLALISAGNEKAFRQMYDLYAARVYTLAIKYLKSPIAAQDAVQDVFIKIWEKRNELSGLENFPAWLHVITRNHLINQLQKKIPVYHSNDQAGDQLPETRHHPQQQLDFRELTAIIIRAVEQLPLRQQQVYRLSREQGLTHPEIAKQLGLSHDTVREHMSKALKNIRIYLEKYYGPAILLLWWFWQV